MTQETIQVRDVAGNVCTLTKEEIVRAAEEEAGITLFGMTPREVFAMRRWATERGYGLTDISAYVGKLTSQEYNDHMAQVKAIASSINDAIEAQTARAPSEAQLQALESVYRASVFEYAAKGSVKDHISRMASVEGLPHVKTVPEGFSPVPEG
ncbi:hypothetical protein HBA54_03250 [Pelagibius litoralis]|uniref:Uncharacterized protein n=1 Tax=Pelagibius litoralis TaxID=374515 RepID=A0A967C378_9PROT|nr:hypothetical protein [Pelagibius litoralis]NIA67599.1 hypothetical protein [Pelagibius litoralis]